MNDRQNDIELLFSYGTLQQEGVQQDTFGRILEGVEDSIQGYVIDQIRITNQAVIAASGKVTHPILRKSNSHHDEVFGTVFQVTSQELAQADEYEVDDYMRISVVSKLGQHVWIYVAKPDINEA